MNRIEKLTLHLSASVKSPYATRLFTLLIFLWFIVQALSLWSVKELMWGSEGVFLHSPRQSNFLNNFFFQLVYEPQRFYALYWIHLCACVVSFFEFRWSFITRIAAWATGLMFYCAAPQGFNSGVLVMLLMAFYSFFVYTKSASSFRNILTNLSRYAMIAQVVMIYWVSAVFKLCGTHWTSGNAVYYVLNIDIYSSPFWQKMSTHYHLWQVVTYMFFAYQMFFPVLLFFKKQRSWLLLTGVLFHLMIGIVMNLWDFAFAMIFCYALFMKEEHAKFLMPFRTLRS